MVALLRHFDRVLPAYRTRHGSEFDALALATGLLVGLVGIVPTFTLTVRYFDVAIPVPSLVATAGVLAAYTTALLVVRRVRAGTLIGLVVLSTFAANVPLSSTEYPGALGPSVWLFELPLVAGLVLAIHDGWHRDLIVTVRGNRANLSWSHVLFAMFVIWSVLAGLFGAGPSTVAGLFFALHMLTALAVFVFVAGAVARGWLRFRTVLSVLVAAAISHMVFGAAQLAHGRNFGLSYVGEASGNTPLVEVLGVALHAGPYVSGLTGNSSPFTALVLLATPVLALHAIYSRSARWVRVTSGVLAIGSLVLVRATLKDAARGAAFVVVIGIVVATVAIAMSARRERDDRLRAWRTRVRDAHRTIMSVFGTTTLAVTALIVRVRVLSGPEARESSSGSSGSAAGSSGASGSAASADASAETASDTATMAFAKVLKVDPASASVRFRLSQYLGAFDAGLDYPLFGLGGANFAYVVEKYGMGPSSDPGIEIGNAVHNAYLSVLSGTGVPGLLLFCGLLLSVLWAAVCLVRDSREERWLSWAALIGVVGYAALIFWNVMLVTIVGTIAFFAFTGAIVGARSRGAEKRIRTPVRSRTRATSNNRDRPGGSYQ